MRSSRIRPVNIITVSKAAELHVIRCSTVMNRMQILLIRYEILQQWSTQITMHHRQDRVKNIPAKRPGLWSSHLRWLMILLTICFILTNLFFEYFSDQNRMRVSIITIQPIQILHRPGKASPIQYHQMKRKAFYRLISSTRRPIKIPIRFRHTCPFRVFDAMAIFKWTKRKNRETIDAHTNKNK